jgi:acyl-CoA reductase-like NAD-dependent aldehyde dehydrogenase
MAVGNSSRMTIDGAAVESEATFDVVNPSTGEVFATAPDCSDAQLEAAMTSAATAFAQWKTDDGARRAVLHKAAGALEDASELIAAIVTSEVGKPLREARGEIVGAAHWLRYYADLVLEPEIVQDDENARISVVRRPLGPVAAITPWNFPLLLSFWKIAPALAAGNTLVLKPSPYTPLSALKAGEVLSGIIPPGVLNVISGRDPLGQRMTEHPIPRKVSFTGSTVTGKRVAQTAAADLKRITLELGGNDAAILLDDVDPATVAQDLFWAAFGNCGQVCSAVKRIYVPQQLYKDVVDAFASIAGTVVVGDGFDESSQLGPLQNRAQFEKVSAMVDQAISSGGRAAAGGHALDRAGNYYAPTIVADVTDGTPLVDSEQFGPALPLISYRDVRDAVAAANATHYGLGGSVWGADMGQVAAIANQMDCGVVWTNTHKVLAPATPFGGSKWSGLGVENGPWGLYGMTELQMVWNKH